MGGLGPFKSWLPAEGAYPTAHLDSRPRRPLHNPVIPAKAGIQAPRERGIQLADAGLFTLTPTLSRQGPVKGEGVTQGYAKVSLRGNDGMWFMG